MSIQHPRNINLFFNNIVERYVVIGNSFSEDIRIFYPSDIRIFHLYHSTHKILLTLLSLQRPEYANTKEQSFHKHTSLLG